MIHVFPVELLWTGQEHGLCILDWDERESDGVGKSSNIEPKVRQKVLFIYKSAWLTFTIKSRILGSNMYMEKIILWKEGSSWLS